MQTFIYCKVTLHVSGVIAPILRSTKNCNRYLWYRSYGRSCPKMYSAVELASKCHLLASSTAEYILGQLRPYDLYQR